MRRPLGVAAGQYELMSLLDQMGAEGAADKAAGPENGDPHSGLLLLRSGLVILCCVVLVQKRTQL